MQLFFVIYNFLIATQKLWDRPLATVYNGKEISPYRFLVKPRISVYFGHHFTHNNVFVVNSGTGGMYASIIKETFDVITLNI